MAAPNPQNTGSKFVAKPISSVTLSRLESQKKNILDSYEYKDAVRKLKQREEELSQVNETYSEGEIDKRKELLKKAQDRLDEINTRIAQIDEAISKLEKDVPEDPTVVPDEDKAKAEALAAEIAEKERIEAELKRKKAAEQNVRVTKNPDEDTQPATEPKDNQQGTSDQSNEPAVKPKSKPKETEEAQKEREEKEKKEREANPDFKLKAIRDQRQKELQLREALQRQYESTRDRDMKEQILNQIEPIPQLKTDLAIIETQDRIKKLKREVDALRSQVLNTKVEQNWREAFSNKKAQIVEKEAQIGELERFFRKAINNASEEVRNLASIDVPISLTRSEKLKREVLEEIDTVTGSMQKRAIRRILSETNPLKALDLNDAETLTPAEINQRYKNLLATLYNSDDPNADRAIRTLQYRVDKFIDTINDTDDTQKIRDQASEITALNRERGAEENKKLYRLASDQNWEDFSMSFRTSEIIEGMRKKYYERRKEAVVTLSAKTLLPAAEWTSAGFGKLKTGTRQGARRVYGSRLFAPVRFGVDKWSSSRFGGWVNQKPGQIRTFFSNVDQGFANFITNKVNINVSFGDYEKRKRGFNTRFSLRNRTSTREEYERRKKKSKSRSQTLLALRGLYEVTVGRAVNAIKNAVSFAKDAAYTYTGMKRLSRMKTAMWNGRVGKSFVLARRGYNGLTAGARAVGSGARIGVISGLVGAAIGLGPAAIPVAGAMTLLGTANQLLSDTLASRSPSPFKFIARFQSKYGYLGTKHYLNSVRMEGPAVATFRGPRHWISSASRSLNAGFYGMGIGTLIGTALGNPLLGAAIGFGTAYSGRLILDRVTNNIVAKAMENQWMARLASMPFFESVGLLSSIPWISNQMKFLSNLDIKGLVGEWVNFRKPLHMLANLGTALDSLHNVKMLLSFSGVSTRLLMGTSALGAGLGLIIATQVLGLSLTTGVVAGAMVGGIIGVAIGSAFLGPIGTILFSTIGSTLGAIFGSWIDKLTGQINVGNQLFGLLSFLKSILDFLKSISGKFDPMAAFGLTLSIIFSVGYLSEIKFSEVYNDSSKTTQSHQVTAQKSIENPTQAMVLGIDEKADNSYEKVTINCLENSEYAIYNPNKSTITSIEKINNYYTIETEHNIFINITKPARNLETYGSISKTSLVGTCK